jgi:hypothetical protein
MALFPTISEDPGNSSSAEDSKPLIRILGRAFGVKELWGVVQVGELQRSTEILLACHVIRFVSQVGTVTPLHQLTTLNGQVQGGLAQRAVLRCFSTGARGGRHGRNSATDKEAKVAPMHHVRASDPKTYPPPSRLRHLKSGSSVKL